MFNIATCVPAVSNEPVLAYGVHTPERATLRAEVQRTVHTQQDIPLFIGGRAVSTKNKLSVCPPHQHRHVVGTAHMGTSEHVGQAIEAAMAARAGWVDMPFMERASIFLRAAEMLSTRYRARINAATMVGQSKTVHQAEIDSACELIDFLRFNVHFAQQIYEQQPHSSAGTWNKSDYRPLEGFVLAIAPFNFTAIAGNLCTAPALMGNTVVFKPATTAALSAQVIIKVLEEAGLPPGVINMVNAPGKTVGDIALTHSDLGGVHFTGSTATFQHIWQTVANSLQKFRSYPRLVGETGGKDFIVAHPSADVEALAVAMVRGAFEYQGQKCSAASRAYIPESLWQTLAPRLEAELTAIKVGDPANFENFMGAVIDAKAYGNIKSYIDVAKAKAGANLWLGGECNDAEGYFIRPTIVLVDDPTHRLMCEEIFGPILTVYRYADRDFKDVLRLCDETGPYALTGAIFARDRKAVEEAMVALRFAAGNFYVNDKPTGAVVGQQPFGGGRASGTNDKAGSALNLLRWTSARTIKETFDPARQVAYPSMQADP